MRLRSKLLAPMWVLLLVNSCMMHTVEASPLSQAQQQKNELQSQIVQTKNKVKQQQQAATIAKTHVVQTHRSILEITNEIHADAIRMQQIRSRIQTLNQNIKQSQAELRDDKAHVANLVRVDYETGHVSYLAVLFNATSFDDLMTRVQALYLFISSERKLLNETLSLQKKLSAEQASQKQNYNKLTANSRHLASLKREKVIQEGQAQLSWVLANRGLTQLGQHQKALEKQLNLTQSQIQALEAEAQQQEQILEGRSGASSVATPSLRYQNISPSKLYDFVHSKNSAFSLADIETICSVAKVYDVNPALMIAITGQELDFVQQGTSHETWKLENPFDVFGSWALYHTNLMQSATYAAEMIQVKLSAVPPRGEDPIIWLNDPKNHAGNGVYATDASWAYGVQAIYNEIEADVVSS
ncbi:hypothetical protein LLE49_12750 [Alicyclobacillus tolerans]|uniref:murein hydrolase activator EnvC family protein n=1 Tax=Alicyclobacillus tolerans TaxID=90970 RepID=UPI001F3F188D|nr:hypothetical protein [Alicyclobacillus tolerans]MCF8565587.1 hypothetical protein [Alicyclobacillus tolerans]